jgi:hypothetical protein
MSDLNPAPDSTEPLWSVGAITAVVTAGLALLVSFGVPLSDDQQSAILGFLAAFAPLAVAALGRSKVYAPATVSRLLNQR